MGRGHLKTALSLPGSCLVQDKPTFLSTGLSPSQPIREQAFYGRDAAFCRLNLHTPLAGVRSGERSKQPCVCSHAPGEEGARPLPTAGTGEGVLTAFSSPPPHENTGNGAFPSEIASPPLLSQGNAFPRPTPSWKGRFQPRAAARCHLQEPPCPGISLSVPQHGGDSLAQLEPSALRVGRDGARQQGRDRDGCVFTAQTPGYLPRGSQQVLDWEPRDPCCRPLRSRCILQIQIARMQVLVLPGHLCDPGQVTNFFVPYSPICTPDCNGAWFSRSPWGPHEYRPECKAEGLAQDRCSWVRLAPIASTALYNSIRDRVHKWREHFKLREDFRYSFL